MKRILILGSNLRIGGIQRALVSLLWEIHGKYEITLLLFWPDGPLLRELPADVKVLGVRSAYRFLGMTARDAKSLGDRLGRAFLAGVSRMFGRKAAIRLMALGQEPIGGFDAAISYVHNGPDRAFYGGCNEFLLNHVRAERRIAFLHCDYGRCGGNTRENARGYAQFDRIAACSEGCAASFCRACPELADRVRVVPNCHRFDWIRLRGQEAAPMDRTKINIVTAARLGREKGVPRAVEAIARLTDRKHIHYYIVGDGVERKAVEEVIRRHGLEETVTLCGEKENPWGHIRSADLLLIPSVSEAAPLVIHEAACLGTPVLSTRTSSAEELIRPSGYGWVCDNSVEGLHAGLEELTAHPGRLEEKRRELSERTFNNARAVARFERLLEE